MHKNLILMLISVAVALGAARVLGVKVEAFQAAAHMFEGGLLVAGVILGRLLATGVIVPTATQAAVFNKRFCWVLFWSLAALELVCATVIGSKSGQLK